MLYWFIPLGTPNEFIIKNGNSNFSTSENGTLQFYKNMRYSDSEISYKISNCTLQKKDDMERAFKMIEEKTILDFIEVRTDEEITVTCESGSRIEEGLFIAGEGGPTKITVSGDYNVIFKGQILLIRKSSCSNPNIALHELLHALGFDHSLNKNNIMFSISNCGQTIGDDIPDLINELYSAPSLPDLVFNNVSATMQGSYLNLAIGVRNNGLIMATESKIKIYADEKLVKEVELEPMAVGYGRGIILENVWVKKRSVDKIEFFIDTDFNELDKSNNHITLELKDS